MKADGLAACPRSEIMKVYGILLLLLSSLFGCGDPPFIDNPPEVSAFSTVGRNGDVIELSYTLTDKEKDSTDITVEFGVGGVYNSAKPAMGGDGLVGLSTSATGIAHKFLWDLAAQTNPPGGDVSITIKITPKNTLAGAPYESQPFTLNSIP